MKKYLLLIGLILIATMAFVLFKAASVSRRGKELIRKCKTLQPGDHENKVNEAMGSPMVRRTQDYNGRKLTLLRYKVPAWFDTFPQVHLNEQSKVEYIVCHQNHRLGKNPVTN